MKNKVILVGSQYLGHLPDDGETMKNYLIGKHLEKYGVEVSRIDLRKRPLRYFYLAKYLYELVFHRDSMLVMSSSSFVANNMIHVAKMMGWKGNKIVYWVVGGSFGEIIRSKRINANNYSDISQILVQGQSMVKTLNECGLTNVRYLPNSKPIDYLPKKEYCKKDRIKFVFLSRVMPEKGVDYIIEAVKKLKNRGIENFIVDLYGRIDTAYENEIKEKMSSLNNIAYNGFLKLDSHEGYDTLASYDVMLFPTYWHGEGFPGILIDAFIAGLPVIATEWNLNTDLIKDGYNGLVIPVHDVNALEVAMEKVVKGTVDVKAMSERVQKEATNYDVDNVITPELLKELNIL